MGKKGKGKKGQKVVADLETFNQQQLKKQQEEEFHQLKAPSDSKQPQSQAQV